VKIADMLTELITLEQQVSNAAKAANPADELRVYPWRPASRIQLPAVYNWIDDSSYEIDDTARATDALVIMATIAVRNGPSDEVLDRLVRLTDVFREVVDPALWANRPLGGTCKRAKRTLTATSYDEFNGVTVMCMDMHLRVELAQIIQPTP
jgi:hypothetical protein